MATERLAAWAAGLQWSAIPKKTQTAAVQSLYNYIGCTIYGSAHPAVHKATAALEPLFGPRSCTILGTDVQTDPQHAALLNGIASHVHDYDDTHLETIIHPTGPVASAILGYAEFKRGISGEQLLTSLVAGIEAECKVGLAVWPTHYNVGWHITSSTGSIGAAVGVGKLMELDSERMAHAIGLASTQVTGLREMFGSDCKSFHPGRAAQAGLLAALLAEKGYTSSSTALEAKRGWANVVICGGEPQLDKYINELGTVWETAKNSFKPFPCGIVKHPAIDAAVQIHKQLEAKGALSSLDSLKFNCQVHPLVIELTSKPKPQDGLQAKFSVFHGVAVGLLYGKAGPGEYADDVVTDPKVTAIRDAVEATQSDKIRSDEAIVTATDSTGHQIARIHVEHAVGSLEVPLNREMLQEKFIDQVSLSHGKQMAEAMSDAAWRIETEIDVVSVIQRLR